MRLLSPTDPRAAGETSPELVQSRSQWIRPTLAPSGRQASGTAVSTASGGGVCGRVSPASHCRNLDAAGVSPLEVYTRERRWHCRAATGRRRHEPEATTLKGQSRIRRRPFNRIRELQKRFFECTTMPVWAGVPPLVAATSTDTRTIRAHPRRTGNGGELLLNPADAGPSRPQCTSWRADRRSSDCTHLLTHRICD